MEPHLVTEAEAMLKEEFDYTKYTVHDVEYDDDDDGDGDAD